MSTLKQKYAHEDRMARRRAEAQAVLEGTRAAGDACSFMEAVGMVGECLNILRVMRRRVSKCSTLRDAARLHAAVNTAYCQMRMESRFTNYAAAVRRVLRQKGMEESHGMRSASALAA